VQCFILHSYII
jgi:hypothetical protein